MSDDTWDRDIDSAWQTCAEALAERLDAMTTNDMFVVEASTAGMPYVQILRLDDEFLVEVSSNRFLPVRHQLSPGDHARLAELSFTEPSEQMPNHWIPIGDGEFAASVIVEVLRTVFDVVHPSFLSGDRIGSPMAQKVPTPAGPTGPHHLKELIDQTLIALTGDDPARDEEGDIPIRVGDCVVYVLPHPDLPIIRLVGLVADDITDTVRAEREVNRVNRTASAATFILDGPRLVARAEVMAAPFVPDHLTMALSRFCDEIAEHEADLVARCRDGTKQTPPHDTMPPAMGTLLDLAARGQLTPALIAKACDHDSRLIADLLTWNVEQESVWRIARDEALADSDTEEAEACEYERAGAEHTVELIRTALRDVLTE